MASHRKDWPKHREAEQMQMDHHQDDAQAHRLTQGFIRVRIRTRISR
jgi:hypothetical protein